MTPAQEILLATAKHFMMPRDDWAHRNRRSRDAINLRRIASDIALQAGVTPEDLAPLFCCKPETVTRLAAQRRKKDLMFVVDIKKALEARP